MSRIIVIVKRDSWRFIVYPVFFLPFFSALVANKGNSSFRQSLKLRGLGGMTQPLPFLWFRPRCYALSLPAQHGANLAEPAANNYH